MTQTILVTGSSRGIGKAIALQLASQGFDIVVHCRSSSDEAHNVSQRVEFMGRQSRVLQFCVSDRAASKDVLTEDIENHGAYYGVVCNAGKTSDAAFPMLSAKDWDSVIQTNLSGLYNVLHPVVLPMIRRKSAGRIVTMSSVSGLMGNRGQFNYSASKGGVIAATKSLALELAKRKITVNCVAPGLIETEMIDQELIDHAMPLIPMRRIGQAEEVAHLVGFLMSEKASYITRQVISVNGGMC